MKISQLFVASLITSVASSYAPRLPTFGYRPSHSLPGASLGGAGGLGGIDPLTLLILQKDGGQGRNFCQAQPQPEVQIVWEAGKELPSRFKGKSRGV